MKPLLYNLASEKPSGLYLIELRAHFARANALKRELIAKVCDSWPAVPLPLQPSTFAHDDKLDLASAG